MAEQNVEKEGAAQNTISILIVEDDLVDRTQLERLLHRSTLSSEIVTTEYLEGAIELLKNTHFDVVLLDLNLPDSGGLDTLIALSGNQPRAAIIVVTGEGGEELGLKAVANGAQDYLIKGEFDTQTLTRSICYSIEHKRAEEERDKTLLIQQGVNSLQQSLLEAIPLEDKLKKVTGDIVKIFDADFCRIWLIKDGDLCEEGCVHAEVKEGPHVCLYRELCLHLVSSSGRYTHIDGRGHRRVPFGCYKIGTIASDNECKFLTNDVQNDPRVHNHQWASELGLVSFAGYQLRIKSRQPLGVLALFSKHPIRPYEDAMLDGLSSTVALAVQQSILSKQLQESENKFRILFESSCDAMMTIEPPSWRFTSCNQAALKLFEVDTAEKFTSLGPWDVSPVQQPDGRTSADKAKEMIEKAIKEGANFFEWTHKQITGEDFPATVLLTRVERNGKVIIQATVRDITAQKYAEEALKQSEARYKSYIEATDQVAWVTNARGEVEEDLPSWRKFTGQTYEEIKGAGWAKAVHPDDVEHALKVWNNSVATKSPYEVEYRMRRHDGVYRSLLARGFPIIETNGNVKEWVGTCIDIAERKRAEAALKASETALSATFTAAPIGILLMKERLFQKINSQMNEICGYTSEELIGRSSLMLYPDKAEFERVGRDLYANLRQTGLNSVEAMWRQKNGTLINVLLSASMLDINDPNVGEVVTVLDITNRKQAEDKINWERKKAKKYLDVAGVMILVLDNGETIHRINQKGCEILGYEENEILGKNWCDLFVPPEQKEEVKLVLKGLMSGEADKYKYHENTILTKSGEQRLIAWHNVVIWDENKKINAVLSSGDDITERKAAEIELLSAYKELEKAHNGMKNMQSQVVQSEKLASIGQLAAGVAHEMNTPVGFVASNFETLQKYFKKFKALLEMYAELGRMVLTADKTQQTAKLAEINKTATDMKIAFVLEDIGALFEESKEGLTRVTKIVQNLRDFSRIDQAEAFDEYDLNHGIEATLIVARNAIKYHADVVTEFSDVPHIPCNASQINQVFLNILVNAAQAIESQRRETNGSIRIKTYSDDTHVICKVIDDGPGIPANIIEKIFDPFFTTKPVGKGTGLGLSVSYDIIVRKHKGELLVKSEVGKGTEFTIKLPIKAAPTAEKRDKETEADATIESSVC